MSEVRKKIVLLGNVGVGKTSLIRKFVFNTFSDDYLSTIGVRVDKKSVDVGDIKVHLMIWDLAGEIFNSKLYATYTQGAHALIGVFDMSRPNTFDVIESELLQQKDRKDFIIIANKSDLVDQEEYNRIKEKYHPDYITSAKDGDDVLQAFEALAKKLL